MNFKEFNLIPELLRAVEELGYKEATPIQSQAIPLIIGGRDLLAAAQTGTGKTASFTLPLLQNLIQKQKPSGVVRCLILTPTRELASQVAASVRSFSKFLPIKSLDVYGGVDIMRQIKTLHRGVDVLIATPGRLLDLVNQKAVRLSQVESLVLDEADRMLDMGFMPDIKRILDLLPQKRQNLLFSATFSTSVKKFAEGLLYQPEVVQIAAENSTCANITETIHPVDTKRKQSLLSFLISSKQWRQVLVFVRTKHGCDKLVDQLAEDGLKAAAIHSNKTQGARMRALSNFKRGAVRILVATDIAARGLDIDQLPYVVNFDLPQVPEDYVHRIGRTGRAGNKGEAISLVSVDEHKLLRDIERLLKRPIPQVVVPTFEPDPTIQPVPVGRRQNRPKQGHSNKPNSSRPQNGRFGRKPAFRKKFSPA